MCVCVCITHKRIIYQHSAPIPFGLVSKQDPQYSERDLNNKNKVLGLPALSIYHTNVTMPRNSHKAKKAGGEE